MCSTTKAYNQVCEKIGAPLNDIFERIISLSNISTKIAGSLYGKLHKSICQKKLLVPNILNIEIMINFRKFVVVHILGHIAY